MATDSDKRLERRVIEAAEQALAARGFVAAIDVLAGLGWLPPSSEQGWRQGRIPFLERAVNANLSKISRAMRHFRRWAKGRGLKPSETAYVARTRDRRPLRFSKSGKPSIELAYRTHWVSPKLSERKRYERQGILVGSDHWRPIVTMARTALARGRTDVARATFAADRPGMHQRYLSERCAELTESPPPSAPQSARL